VTIPEVKAAVIKVLRKAAAFAAASGAGYDSGYRKGRGVAFASVKKRTLRDHTGDFELGFLTGAGTCLAVGITIRLQQGRENGGNRYSGFL